MSRKLTAILSAAALTTILVGCSTGGETTAEAPAGTNRPTATDTAEATEAEAPAPSANPTFGTAYTWDDGLAITVSAPEPYTPTESAAAEPAAAYVAFTVTIVNGSEANYEPSMFTATVQSANVEGSQVFDYDAGMEGAPSTVLLPGREVVFKIAYGVADPADIVMEVSPSFEHDSAVFTS